MGDDDKPDKPNDAESAETLSEALTVADFDAQPPEDLPGGVLTPGQQFGSYEIIRPLGKGGMGEVYEAYDTRTERHVALKVLRERLSSETDRKRFLREGRLAAQVSHPNSVFVVGTEEIEGTQVIAMELMPGGTLKDRVEAEGPLPVREAVDLILQLISGLDAAEAKGMLHRDIKPANCFVASDGSVKVGDYGLSIPTSRDEYTQVTRTGSFMGTPAFASPEHLQDRDLDIRSDGYSVGATLYWLVTGRLPFTASTPEAFIGQVLTEAPAEMRPRIRQLPRGFEDVVRRALAKRRSDRYQDYDAFRKALLPYSSAGGITGKLSFRATAYLVDQVVLGVFSLGVFLAFGVWQPTTEVALAGVLVSFTYFAFCEWRWGATLGKAILRLRVRAADGVPATWAQILLRNLVFNAVINLFPTLVNAVVLSSPYTTVSWWPFLIFAVASALLLSTMRPRNGLAGLHEFASGTRVQAVVPSSRPHMHAGCLVAKELVRGRPSRLGPFRLTGQVWGSGESGLFTGIDDLLRRDVWLRTYSAGAQLPPVGGLDRASGGLRWLGRSRQNEEARWDAFEAVPGMSIARWAERRDPVEWNQLASALRSLAARWPRNPASPTVCLRHLWASETGDIVIAPFPLDRREIPGDDDLPFDDEAFPALVHRFIRALLGGKRADSPATDRRSTSAPGVPLPIYARSFVESALGGGTGAATPRELAAKLAVLQDRPAIVSRLMRIGPLALPFVPLVLVMGMLLALGVAVALVMPKSLMDLGRYEFALEEKPTWAASLATPELRAVEMTVAHAYEQWRDSLEALRDMPNVPPPDVDHLEEFTARYGNASADDLARARPIFERLVPDPFRDGTLARRVILGSFNTVFRAGGWLAVLSLAGAFILRGGLLFFLFGISVVRPNGASASRLRCLSRAVVAWTPFLWFNPVTIDLSAVRVTPGELAMGRAFITFPWIMIALFVLAAACAAYAIINPERGIQDRIAGTYLVPR